MYSVEISPDLVQIQTARNNGWCFLARLDIPIQVRHMVEAIRKDFNEYLMTQVPITEN